MGTLRSHLRTVRIHRAFVRKACFKLGIPVQGLLHDLSKYSLVELRIHKWYTGKNSPHDQARQELGYSPAWYHHRNKNKHHSEYWVDSFEKLNAVKMEYRYVIEMVADFIAASKTYEKESYTIQSPWNYWVSSCKGKRVLHLETELLLEKLLWSLHESRSEAEFFKEYHEQKKYLKKKYNDGGLKESDNSIGEIVL